MKADALNRRPDHEEKGRKFSDVIFKENEDGITYNHQVIAVIHMKDSREQRLFRKY